MNVVKKIFGSFSLSSAILLAVGGISLINDKYRKNKSKTSNTLVPVAIIGSYVTVVAHLYWYYRKHNHHRSVKEVNVALAIVGLAIMLGALGVGGVKYKFKRCCYAYSRALIPWAVSILGSYLYYRYKNNRERLN